MFKQKVFEEAGQSEFTVRYPYEEIIFDRETELQRVTLVRTRAFGRALFLDSILNSAESDEFIYHEGIVHPAMLRAAQRRRVLVIGGAEGGTLREVLRYPEVELAVMVDIDRELVELCRQHLADIYGDPWSDPRTRLFFGDGRNYIEESSGFDVIILDLNEARDGGPAQRLFTREFYSAVRGALAPGGVVSVQAEWITSDFHRQLTSTLRGVFAGVRPQEVNIPSFLLGEAFNICCEDPARLHLEAELIDRMLEERGIELRYYCGDIDRRMGTLAPYQLDAYLTERKIFTDLELPVYDLTT